MGSEKKIDVEMLNDIALINNELANTQRSLAKKNAEVQQQNIELVALNLNLEQFTSIASHDLQEPLRMITGFMELLKTRYGSQLDDKANSYIDFALDGGRRMQEMVVSLLEFSKAGRETSLKEMKALAEILNDVRQNISRLIEEKETTIIVETELPVLPVFKSGIAQLFQNLISNAIKFTEATKPPLIKIAAMENDHDWLITVSDNGIGLDPGSPNIFEIFGRANTLQKYEGHGIGLAVCKKVVENHGGKIWVESKQNLGSVFYFTLPKGEVVE